ncbi:MAG: ABC transporter ATP-binding protein [Actinomycetota bacterium]
MTVAAIELRDIAKTYGPRARIGPVSLVVPAGVVFGFLGPNGAGKSTVIRLCAGLLKADGGSALIGGRPLAEALRSRRVGFMLEGQAFFSHLSARENLLMLAKMHAAVPVGRVDGVLDLVELSSRSRERVGGYSLGMKQRLSLASALLADPDVLILDEPSNGLDPPGLRLVRNILESRARAGCTIFLSSHNLTEVERVCSHVAFIRRGALVYQGEVAELLSGSAAVCVVASDFEAVRDVLSGAGLSVRVDGGAARVEGAAPAEVCRILAGGGIFPEHISAVSESLEEAFIRLVGGRSGDPGPREDVGEPTC